MKAAFSAPWAKSPSNQRREPTPQEIVGGFPCGAADQQLFNELMYRLSLTNAELINVLAGAGVTPNENDTQQLLQALRIISGRRTTEISTAGRVFPSLTPVANQTYVMTELLITGASSVVAFGAIFAEVSGTRQASCGANIRVIRTSDNAIIDTSPVPGTVIGNTYANDGKQVCTYSSVAGLAAAETYKVELITLSTGFAEDLRFYGPYLSLVY